MPPTSDMWSSIIHPDDIERFFTFAQKIVVTGESGTIECRTFTKQGQETPHTNHRTTAKGRTRRRHDHRRSGPGHHRTQTGGRGTRAPSGPTSTGPEDGSRGSPDGRNRSRLQQSAHRHSRQYGNHLPAVPGGRDRTDHGEGHRRVRRDRAGRRAGRQPDDVNC